LCAHANEASSKKSSTDRARWQRFHPESDKDRETWQRNSGCARAHQQPHSKENRRGTILEGFNFDELAALAKNDPEAFEQRRQEMIDALFASIEARSDDPQFIHRLRGLQFRIDMERRRSRTSMRALLRIYSMMWDSFIELNDLLQRISRPMAALPGPAAPHSAQVIPFQPAAG
jgi:Protein of unknown function (DUF3135)